ncbi:MAG TPA: hypothetical protein DF712_17670 [Balneola sp.]|nr:hypothetical protein [Balneola sp.]|tara:strand:+ start:246 stop:449 length:204 start_codon:yes stop_codon:yes gene_type:complete
MYIKIYARDAEVIDHIEHVLLKNRVKFNILEKDDKSDPPSCIIYTSKSKKELDDILKKRLKKLYILR